MTCINGEPPVPGQVSEIILSLSGLTISEVNARTQASIRMGVMMAVGNDTKVGVSGPVASAGRRSSSVQVLSWAASLPGGWGWVELAPWVEGLRRGGVEESG